MTSEAELSELLGRSEHIMFDFDGPVCSVFAGRPAPSVAQRLRELVERSVQLPASLQEATDPMLFLYAAPDLPPDLGERVRRQLRAEELAAIDSAEPTPGARSAIKACHDAGKVVSVVSNNDAEAVTTYLQRHDLLPLVRFVSARQSPDPLLMKPNPYLVLAAVEATGQLAERSVLIGDSLTDIAAAHAARSTAIGFANRPGKYDTLIAAGADAIISDMEEIIAARP